MSSKADGDYLHNVTVVSVAERVAFINRVFGKGGFTRDGRNYDVRCPICDESDKLKWKLSINATNDLNQCWVCGWTARNLAPLIRRFGTPEDLREYTTRFLALSNEAYDLQNNAVIPRPRLPDDFELLALENKTLSQRRARTYLMRRGLSIDDLWRYRFGISEEKYGGRVIFPSFDARGQLNYYAARATWNGAKRRYLNPPADRRDVIFNEMYVDWKKTLVLCEGPFDSVKCGDNAVPLLGNRLSPRSRLFCRIVENETPVVVALDPQETEKIHALTNLFSSFNVDARVVDLGNAKDPGEMSKESFKASLARSTSITWDDTFRMKLGKATSISLNTRL